MEETAADSAAPAETRVNLKARWQAIPRKKRRRIIRLCILALLLVIAAVVLLKVLGGKSSDEGEVVTDIVQYGSITSTVQGSGLTKAKSSETITITTVGTVVDVLVAEGETVTAGTPLFTIDSPAAETAVQKARSNVEGYEKQLSQAQKDIAGLNLSAGYAGKLMETVTLNPGDSITKGQKVAVLSDDTRLRLEQYYSYAYAGDLQVGQTVNVSIPALMTSVPGTVEDHETCKAIQAAGSFSVTLLGADAPGEIIDLFGYKSGRVTDKFAGRAAETDSNGNPYLKEHMVSRIACKVVDQMEIGSFLLFVGQATEAEVLGDGRVLTLQAYTDRGKATPPTATVYRTVEINGYRCTVCGYVYEGESLPPDFRCPLCHAPAEKFVKIEK